MPAGTPVPTFGASASDIPVLIERLRALADAMDEIRQSLQHMATKEQVAQLAKQSDLDRLRWELDALKEKVNSSSVMNLLKNWAVIASAITSAVAIWAAFRGHP